MLIFIFSWTVNDTFREIESKDLRVKDSVSFGRKVCKCKGLFKYFSKGKGGSNKAPRVATSEGRVGGRVSELDGCRCCTDLPT